MTLKFSELPRARPPETTLVADCSSGRSDFWASSLMKRVWVGRATSTVVFSTGAEPLEPTAVKEARRMVATTAGAAGASTVTMALPA